MVSKITEKNDKLLGRKHSRHRHLIRVWTYAKTIGELEGLDSDTQFIEPLVS